MTNFLFFNFEENKKPFQKTLFRNKIFWNKNNNNNNKIMKNLKNIFKQSEFERSKPGHFEQSGEHLAATKSKRSQPINLSTCMLFTHICRTVVMRTCLLVYSVMIIYFVTCMIQDSVKWLLLIPLVFIILDAVFICVVRKGIEFDW